MKKWIGFFLVLICTFSMTGCGQTETTTKKGLTLADVRELAEKGEALSWSDFEQYSYREIGSGLHIFRYDIDENYCLLIGGKNTQTKPMYIRLVYKATDSTFISDGVYIDIRNENVDDFINSLD